MSWRGQPLTALRHAALERDSGWRYTGRLRDAFCARWWGLTPAEFDRLPYGERADMIAAYEARQSIDAVNEHEAMQKARR